MNLINQAAEDWNKSDERDYTYTGSILHFLQFLSQQGDAAIARSIIEGSISTWYNQDDAEELLCKALAIGRASNRWIPVTERLPEEKDAVDAGHGCKVVEICTLTSSGVWISLSVVWTSVFDNGAQYWRTPSQYPEPPKSKL